jgi:MtN3 and saliva related transmembrane protein
METDTLLCRERILNIADIIGYSAAACTTFSFIPQILKIRRQGGKDLSYPMLFTYLFGLLLWLAYGIAKHANAVVVANAVSSLLVLIAILAKATTRIAVPAGE